MPDHDPVQLRARAEIPTAELTVLDSRFQFVHRGVGAIDVALPPGAYLLQFKVGTSVVDIPVVLRPGSRLVEITTPKLSTKSPAPIGSGQAAARYRAFAKQSSHEIGERHDDGGELFVFIRTSTTDLKSGRSNDMLFDVQLLDADFTVLMDLRTSGKRSPDASAVTCNLQLPSGTYLLRYKAVNNQTLEQAVFVSEGWQTQIFASSRDSGDADSVVPNFSDAAVSIVPRGAGFDPDDINLVRAESARIALAGGCDVVPEERLREVAAESKQIHATVPSDQVRQMLRSRFQNPMLGIYGAHLMLTSAVRDWDLLREVVKTLKALIGDHPDVLALTLMPEMESLSEPHVFRLPPMLRNSWTLIVNKSVTQADLVPADAYAAHVANRMWGSSGWLVWNTPPVELAPHRRSSEMRDATPSSVADGIAVVYKYVLEKQRALGVGGFLKQVIGDSALSDTERAVVVYAISAVQQGRVFRDITAPIEGVVERATNYLHGRLAEYKWADILTGGLQPDPAVQEHFAPGRLVQAIGVPAAALDQAILSLADKVRGDVASR